MRVASLTVFPASDGTSTSRARSAIRMASPKKIRNVSPSAPTRMRTLPIPQTRVPRRIDVCIVPYAAAFWLPPHKGGGKERLQAVRKGQRSHLAVAVDERVNQRRRPTQIGKCKCGLLTEELLNFRFVFLGLA